MMDDDRYQPTTESRWKIDPETGEDVMPPMQARFLEEQCATLVPLYETEKEWCEVNGISDRAVRRWKQNQKFLTAWERAAEDAQASPDFIAPIIRNMHQMAKSQGPAAVKAAEMLLKLTERLKPPTQRIEVARDDDFASFSDAELASFVSSATQEA